MSGKREKVSRSTISYATMWGGMNGFLGSRRGMRDIEEKRDGIRSVLCISVCCRLSKIMDTMTHWLCGGF